MLTFAACNSIPIHLAHWREDMQQALIRYLGKYDVNERLSHFIIQYLDYHEIKDNVTIIEEFREFVSK